jgi:hypothetical protein
MIELIGTPISPGELMDRRYFSDRIKDYCGTGPDYKA